MSSTIDNSSAYAVNVDSIVNLNKPHTDKPTLRIKKSNAKINTIEEILTHYFEQPVDENNIDNCKFFIRKGKIASMRIPVEVYRMLRALYQTVGRLPEEMEALYFLQAHIITQLPHMTNIDGAVTVLSHIEATSETCRKLISCLISLCRHEI